MKKSTFHASAVAWQGSAILITGGPGSGKSSQALRWVERGAELIADDLVEVWQKEDGAFMAGFPQGSPAYLQGCLWHRFWGLIAVPFFPGPLRVGRKIQLLP